MEYIILTGDTTDELMELVNEKLEEGYTLQGGVSVSMTRDQGYSGEIFAQAMIK
jgi:hypothetical protein